MPWKMHEILLQKHPKIVFIRNKLDEAGGGAQAYEWCTLELRFLSKSRYIRIATVRMYLD